MRKLPTSTITRFKNAILGRDFDLSVAYVSRAAMQKLNAAHRKIKKPTDILSFSYTKKSGEVVLCMPEVVTHARTWQCAPMDYLPYLVIHGLIHIKGRDHGAIMDKEEKKYCRTLGVTYPGTPTPHGTTNRSRSRRRHVPGTSRRVSLRRSRARVS